MATLAGGTVAAGRLRAGPGVGEREAIRLDWGRSAERLGAPADPEFAAAHLRRYGCRTEVADRRTVLAVPRAGASTWSSGPTWRRRWPGAGATTSSRRPCRPPPGAASPPPSGCAARPGGPGRHGRDRGPDLPVPVPGRPRPARAARRRPPPPDPAPGQPALGGGARAAHHPAARPGRGGRRNLAKGLDGVAVHELGAVFLPDPDQELPDEPLTLGVLLAGQAPAGRHDDPRRPFDFADAKGVVEGLVAALGVPGSATGPRSRCPTTRAAAPPCSWRAGRSVCSASSTRGWRPPASCPRPRSRSSWSWPAAGRGAADAPGGDAVAVPGAPFDVAFLVPPGWRPATWRTSCARPAATCWPG